MIKINRQIFNAEIEKIPIKIIESSYESYLPLNFSNDTKRSGFLGEFNPKKKTIFIYKYIPLYRKMWILQHEKKHYLCYLNKCRCYIYDVMSECHAFYYSMDVCYKNNWIESLYDLIRYIDNNLNFSLSHEIKDYNDALLLKIFWNIKQSKKWKKYNKFLMQENLYFEKYT